MIHVIWYFCLGFIALAAALGAETEQNVPWQALHMDKTAEELILSMNSLEFGKWASDKLKDFDRTKVVPTDLINASLLRLKHSLVIPAGMATNIATCIAAATVSGGISGELLGKDTKVNWAASFLEEVYFGTKDQPLVRSEAGESICEFLALMPGTREKIVSIRLEMLKERNELILALTSATQNDRIDAAAGLKRQGKKEAAESLFIDAISYPWYLLRNGEDIQKFRDYYVRAMLLLIDLRRGNLEKLKELSIIPAASKFVSPALERAITEASTGQNKPSGNSEKNEQTPSLK